MNVKGDQRPPDVLLTGRPATCGRRRQDGRGPERRRIALDNQFRHRDGVVIRLGVNVVRKHRHLIDHQERRVVNSIGPPHVIAAVAHR